MEGINGIVVISAAWRVLSALGVVAIGAFSLWGGNSRPRGALAFGLFAIAWGLQITLGVVNSLVTTAEAATLVYLLFLACSLPVTYLLVEFSVSYLAPRKLAWRALRLVAAGSGLVAGLLLVFQPDLLFGGIVQTSQGLQVERGPLFVHLIAFPQFAAFGLALIALASSVRTAPTPRTSLRAATLLAGLGVYVGYTSGYYLAYYSVREVLHPASPSLFFILTFLGSTLVTAFTAARALESRRTARTPQERNLGLFAALALLVPLAWGTVEGVLALTDLPLPSSLGLWRLVGVGIIAYGLARWRWADLPQRTVRAAAGAAGATGAVVTGVAAFGGTAIVVGSGIGAALVGLLLGGMAFVPSLRLARKLFSRAAQASWDDSDDRLYGQRVEAYRAALESAMARSSVDEDEKFLGALRERFGISDSEDRLLRYYARSSVLIPREGSADAVYDRLRLLGEGGAGRTWLARDRVRDRLVVLKEPLERWQREPSVRESVLREARLAARIRHGNVIRVEEVVENRGTPIIVMEFCEGGSLADLLRRRGTLPWQEAIELTVQILRGVEAIHQAGILHRDLKPSNVLLDAEGTPKIADFGIAIPSSPIKTLVEGGTTFAGTLAYMAPEVRAGSQGDRRADVYAVAAMLHECLYASAPNPNAPVVANEDVPSALSRVLARALAPDAAHRHPSARGLAEDLTSLVVVGGAR